MAMFFPYFELASSLFILLLGFQIWSRHYENKVARFYSLFALVGFLAAILTYSQRIAFTLEIAQEINRLSATLWAFVFAMYAHFTLLFTKKDRWLRNPFSYFFLYLPPTILGTLFLFTDKMYLRYEILSVGIVSQPAPLYALFILETVFFILFGIVNLLLYAFSTPQKTEKFQAILIAIGSIIPVTIGILTDQLLPLLCGFRPTIPTVVFDITIMNIFIYTAMRRYSLFTISPALAADVIVKTMPDSLLVTDLEGRIIFVNEEALLFFRVPREEVLGREISDLFIDKNKYTQLYNEIVDKKLVVERFQAELLDPLGERIPALINAALLREKVIGETIGLVYIVRDIRG